MSGYTCAHEAGINELIVFYSLRQKEKGSVIEPDYYERTGRVEGSAEFYLFDTHVGIRTPYESLAGLIAHRVRGYAPSKEVVPRLISGVWWVLFVPELVDT